MKIFVFVLVCRFFAQISPELCSESVSMYDLPKGVLISSISIATTGTVVGFKGCPETVKFDPEAVGFLLYNKENLNSPIRLNRDSPSEIKPSQKIIFVTHGWTCNITGNGFPQLKNAYLQRYPEANIILIEWTTYSVDLYVNSFCAIPKISEVFGKFICNLHEKYNVDVSQLHLVGHSMGGQISGLTGQETQKQCNKKIGRITALDPAGPIYQLVPPNRRLDPSDAMLVDVIHSNQGQFGYYGKCGTVDYFPNCGYFQPGCLELTPTTNISEYLNLPFSVFSCSHQRSIEYFVESINAGGFASKSCSVCPGIPPRGPCRADILRGSISIMGEDHEKNPGTSDKYYLKTASKSPFSLHVE